MTPTHTRFQIALSVALGAFLVPASCTKSFAQVQGPTQPVRLQPSGRQISGVGISQTTPIPSGSSTAVQVQVQGSYSGSIAEEGPVSGKFAITLTQAIQRALRANLGAITTKVSTEQARSAQNEARAGLLPTVNVSASENVAKVNLAAEGFSADLFGATVPFQFPSSVGPFHYYDLHGAVQQPLLDLTAIHNLRAQRDVSAGSLLEARQAREEIVLAVSGVYLQLMADMALLDRQQVEVAFAEATYTQAKVQVDAGTKAEIEETRNLVELQTEKQRLRSQAGQIQKRQIQLARLIGMAPGTDIVPQEKLSPLPSVPPDQDSLIGTALSQRQDLQAARLQVHAAEQAKEATSAQHLPSAGVSGTYGLQGINPNQGASVFQVQASLNIPIFEGGRIRAETVGAAAVLRQRTAEYADQRGAIEAEVRTALVDLQVADDQLTLAENSRRLALKTLQQSQDRFSVGVADSVEVVSSQELLATADNNYVGSMFAQHVAKIALAHAMGEAERDVADLFTKDLR